MLLLLLLSDPSTVSSHMFPQKKKHLQANAQLQEASNRAAEARLEDQQSKLI